MVALRSSGLTGSVIGLAAERSEAPWMRPPRKPALTRDGQVLRPVLATRAVDDLRRPARTRRPRRPASRRAGANILCRRASAAKPRSAGGIRRFFRWLKLSPCVSQKFWPSLCQLTVTNATPASISRRARARGTGRGCSGRRRRGASGLLARTWKAPGASAETRASRAVTGSRTSPVAESRPHRAEAARAGDGVGVHPVGRDAVGRGPAPRPRKPGAFGSPSMASGSNDTAEASRRSARGPGGRRGPRGASCGPGHRHAGGQRRPPSVGRTSSPRSSPGAASPSVGGRLGVGIRRGARADRSAGSVGAREVRPGRRGSSTGRLPDGASASPGGEMLADRVPGTFVAIEPNSPRISFGASEKTGSPGVERLQAAT